MLNIGLLGLCAASRAKSRAPVECIALVLQSEPGIDRTDWGGVAAPIFRNVSLCECAEFCRCCVAQWVKLAD